MTPQLVQTCLELSKTFQCHPDPNLHNMFVDVSVINRGGKILGVKLLLETPQVDRPTLQIRAKYALAHNCSRFAAVDILREGLVRPCATELPTWIYTSGFLLSSSCQTHDESSFQQALTEALAKASKYSSFSDIFGPMCIFGLALGRQPSHVAINQGGTTADHGCLQTFDASHSRQTVVISIPSMSSTWRRSIL